MTAPIDYQAVLADLRARRRQLDAAIASIETILGSGASTVDLADDEEASAASETNQGSTPPATRRPVGAGAGIQNDTFFGLSTAAAIRKYLNLMKRPQTPKNIADALQAGGQIHAVDEKSAYVNTYSALRKGLARGETVQIKNGDWGLAEWYANKPKGESE